MTLAKSRALLADIVVDVLGPHLHHDTPRHEVPDGWSTVAELGWPLVGLDEAVGGAGGTLADLVAIVEASGRVAAHLPLIETALARWAAGAAAGSWGPTAIATAVTASDVSHVERDGTMLLDGTLTDVPWASVAAHLVVVGDGWTGLLDLPSEDVLSERAVNIADEPRCTVQLTAARADLVAHVRTAGDLRNRLALLRSAAMVGTAEGALQLAIEHVRTCEQFDRPVAHFQLVAGAVAQMASEVTIARGAVEGAVDAHLLGADVTARTAAALVTAARAASLVARSAHQVHGAIGITREHALHRFTRRLWAWRDDAGPERAWQEHLGRHHVHELGPDGFWDLLTSTCRVTP